MSGDWERKRLGDVLELQYGKPLPTELRDENGRYPAYGANGVKCRTNHHYCTKPGIVLGRKGSAGEVVLTEPQFWPLDVTYYLEFDEGRYDLRFLYYLLSSLDLPSLAKGVKPGINRNDVYAIEAAFPSLPEQKRIVAIIDDASQGIDAAIANTEKNLASADQLYSSYLDTVLKQKVGDWAESRLGDLVSIRHGFAFKSEYFVEDGEYVLLTPGNFFEGGGYRDRGEKQKYYDGDIPDGYILSEGALLVAMTEQAAGLLGSPLVVPESGRFLHNQRLGLVVPRDGVPFSNEFFFHAFNSPAFRREIHATASGVKVRHTSPAKLGDAVISFPRTREGQQEVAAGLSEVRQLASALKSSYERKLKSLIELKQSILQKVFSGELTAGAHDREVAA